MVIVQSPDKSILKAFARTIDFWAWMDEEFPDNNEFLIAGYTYTHIEVSK